MPRKQPGKSHRSKPSSGSAPSIRDRRRSAKTESSLEYVARRAEILRAAAEVFRKKGYAGTTLAAVAAAAGTDRASLYYYAADKDELFAEVMGRTSFDLAQRAEQVANAAAPAAARLRILIVDAMTSFDENYPYQYMHLHEHLDFVDDSRSSKEALMGHLRWRQRHFNAFRRVIEDGVREGTFKDVLSPAPTAFAVIGMVAWSYRWFDPSTSPFSGQEIGEAFADLFLNGLLTRP